MSIQWTFTAFFLYLEIAVVILMLLPIFSQRRWNKFFKTLAFSMFQQYAAMYFYVFVGVLCLFLFDAVGEMRKYSHNSEAAHTNLSSETKGSVKLFRAQRNFYIIGFTIFLALVIRRLVTMLMFQNELATMSENIFSEAEAAVKLAKQNLCASTLQADDANCLEEIKENLSEAYHLLNKETKKSKNLEEEAKKWKLMYLEAEKQIFLCGNGKGDEQ